MNRLLVVCAVLMVLPFLASAGTLPDTGQMASYAIGDDGFYSPCNPHSYTDLGNGIVCDTVTGLEWQQETAPGMYSWQQAIDYCDNLVLGGHSDWRLPTMKELYNIVDSNKFYPGPTLNSNYFPNTASSCYWSANMSVDWPPSAWSVCFHAGLTNLVQLPDGAYVRAVRGVQSSHDFVDNTDGTITDTSTGLMWELKTDDGSPLDKDNTYTWQDALSYCEDLTIAGYNDWRLPNINELQSIVDYTRNNPSIYPIFSNTMSGGYWSSTTPAMASGCAMLVSFGGSWGIYWDGKLFSYYVRAVRGGQCGTAYNGRVALLVRNSNQLDADEENIQRFLPRNAFSFDIVDSATIKSGAINLSNYNVLYMRTSSEPTEYNDPDVISKIRTRIESGAKLILEYYGLYLGAYIGVGTIGLSYWNPVVNDASYFVEAITNSSLFNNISSWSPPYSSDNNNQLLVQLTQLGSYAYPVFNFSGASQSIMYWMLYTTYGWPWQNTDSEYCLNWSGLCTSERSVWSSDEWNHAGIDFINLGQGSIYKLGLNIGGEASANNIIIAPAANQMRRNIIVGQLWSFVDTDGDSIPDITEHNYTTSGNSGHIAEPVNTALGNYTHQHTDLKILGRELPFEFKRGYNSLDPYNGPLGHGWTHNYNISVGEYTSAAVVKWGDGHEDVYNNQGGSFVPTLPGIYDTLVKNVDSTYTLTRKDQSQYQFNTSGKLTSIADKNGNTISLSYDGNGNLSTITDTTGRNITLTYNAENRITLITDPIGRTIGYLYDANGDLVKVTDARSGETLYGYDTAHRITSITLPRGNTLLVNTYDTEGRVATQTNGRGYTTTFAYNTPEANHTTITDHLNHTTIHTHDVMHRLLENVDPLEHSLQYTYDTNSNRTQVTDKRSNALNYTYDAMGNVTSKTDPLSNATSITYDSNNNPLTRTDALSNGTAYGYDGIGNLTSITDALSHASNITYNSNGQPLTVTDANGNTTTNTYDTEGNLISIEDALHNTTTFTYDGIGRRLTVTDANNHTTTFTYDANDNPLTITDPLTGVITYTYDANNNKASVIDPKGNTTSYVYNTNDLLISTTDELSNVTTYAYDELDRKSSITDARENSTHYNYDAAGNLIQVQDALNNTTGYSYDANGNMISMTNAKGQVTNYTYDALNRLTRITDPLGNAAENTYDALGRLAQVKDAKGNTTSYTYDALGRLTKVTDAMAKETIYGYDNVGNRTSITDARGNANTFIYNTVNRLIGKTDPLLNSYSYSYDPVGNRISLTDANGTTITYSYDDNNRLDTITYPNASTVSFTYDANGNRTHMADPNGTATYQYDELNRMLSATDAYGKTVGYSYDAVGNRISLTYPGSKVVDYTYDALNRISTVTDWLSGVTTYNYDVTSNVSHIVNPNNTTVDYSYDNANRLIALANKKSDASIISSYNYTLDKLGNHTKVLRVTPLDPDFTPGTQNYSYDEDNRMMSVNAATYTFDDNGNMTGNSAGDLYAYDYEDRLLEASRGGSNSYYTYDGVGNRIARVEDSITTKYVLDVNGALTNVLAETDGSGNIAAYYVYGLGLISRIKPDNSVQYYHYDNRGSTVALTNAAESITDKYEYDEFGDIANAEGTTPNPFQYVGRFGIMDEGNGLQYMRARYYDAGVGRFLNKDVLQGNLMTPQELNRYAYVVNNPVSFIDVTGLTGQRDAEHLSTEDFYEEMKAVLINIEDQKPAIFWPWDYMKYDSNYYWNGETLYYFEGEYVYGHELNYYTIGLLYKYFGYSESLMIDAIAEWKMTTYIPTKVGIIDRPGGTYLPSENTYQFALRGYDEYESLRQEILKAGGGYGGGGGGAW